MIHGALHILRRTSAASVLAGSFSMSTSDMEFNLSMMPLPEGTRFLYGTSRSRHPTKTGSHDRVGLEVRVVRIVRELPDDYISGVAVQIRLGGLEVERTRSILLAKGVDKRRRPVGVVDAHLVDRLSALVDGEVVARHELNTRVRRGEDRIR